MCWGRQGSRGFGKVAGLGQVVGSLLARRGAGGFFLEQVVLALLGAQRPVPLLVRGLGQDAAGPVDARWIEGAPAQGEVLQTPSLPGGRVVEAVVGVGLVGEHEGGWCGDDGGSCRGIVCQW